MDLEITRIFVKVVQNSSFTRAAAHLKLPKSTVSKAITRLESEAGTKLLVRTTRSLRLTEAGRHYYGLCLGPIQSLEEAQKSLEGTDGLLSGHVRITAPEDLGTAIIAPTVGALTLKHPGLSFEMIFTDEVVDLVKDGFDLAVRIGKLSESRLKFKKLGTVTLVIVASPAYLKRAPKIKVPADLSVHNCLGLNNDSMAQRWTLRSKKETLTTKVAPRLICNQTSSLMHAAIADAGLALVPLFLCRPEIEKGRLERVLPEWSTPGMPVSLLSPLGFSSSLRLKTTYEALNQELAQELTEKV